MARKPLIDIVAHLETHRHMVLTWADLVAKSTELHAQMLASIEASVALLSRQEDEP